jgi:multidrug resistance efflux pump
MPASARSRPTCASAQTTLDQNRRDYERSKLLAESKLISQSALEDSRKALELSESDLTIAQAQIRNAEASVQTRKASLEQARIDLSRTQIRSPIDGVVIQRSIDLGQTVAASLQAPVLFKIAQDPSQIRIEARWTRPISARSMPRMRPRSRSMPFPTRISTVAWRRCALPPPRCRTWSPIR